MALTANIRSLIQRIVLSDVRTSVRFYSEQAKETAKEESVIDPAKDRTKPVPVETSIRYLNSNAYQQTYGEKAVWSSYRRNHKGGFAPRNTRKSCVRNGIISTGNPCPICRDEYLVLDHRNINLLKQFISKYTGQVCIALFLICHYKDGIYCFF